MRVGAFGLSVTAAAVCLALLVFQSGAPHLVVTADDTCKALDATRVGFCQGYPSGVYLSVVSAVYLWTPRLWNTGVSALPVHASLQLAAAGVVTANDIH
jgi:hypothetical protein